MPPKVALTRAFPILVHFGATPCPRGVPAVGRQVTRPTRAGRRSLSLGGLACLPVDPRPPKTPWSAPQRPGTGHAAERPGTRRRSDRRGG